MKIIDLKGRVKLNDGNKMPYLGLGVYKAKTGEEVYRSVRTALDVGYRLIDTAKFYGNEKGVGRAIRESGVDRSEVFVTTKLWIDDQGENTEKALQNSLKELDMDYVDLFLIHWPVPGQYLKSWEILQKLKNSGRTKSIGVSNCLQHQLESIKNMGGEPPAVLQNEFHPRLIQQDLLDHCKSECIQYQSWSPLMRGQILQNELLNELAEKYGKTEAQVVLRWNLQKGVATIPKSVHENRIRENAEIFDFKLSETEVQLIDSLENGYRTGAHPDHFMEHFNS